MRPALVFPLRTLHRDFIGECYSVRCNPIMRDILEARNRAALASYEGPAARALLSAAMNGTPAPRVTVPAGPWKSGLYSPQARPEGPALHRRPRPASPARRPRRRSHRARVTRSARSTAPPDSSDDPAPGEAGPKLVEYTRKIESGNRRKGGFRA